MMNKIKGLLNKGIDVNVLKVIAIIAMTIDHVGYYFQNYMSHEFYTILRIIGRIAMPIFTYCIVQGFFYTKSLKKYIKRVSILAIVTQILISILGILNVYLVKDYTVTAYRHGNILFSFSLGLILLYLIHNRIVIKKWDYNKNIILKVVYCIILFGVYIFIPIDYNFEVVLLMIMFYFIEKLKITTYLNIQTTKMDIKKIIASTISEKKIIVIYNIMIVIPFVLLIVYMGANTYMLLALPFIWLYNGEKKDNKYINGKVFYYFFPIHHGILYTLAVCLNLI